MIWCDVDLCGHDRTVKIRFFRLGWIFQSVLLHDSLSTGNDHSNVKIGKRVYDRFAYW